MTEPEKLKDLWKTVDELCRWDLAWLLSGGVVRVTPNVPYLPSEIATRQDAAFIQFLGFSQDKLRELAHEFLLAEGEAQDIRILPSKFYYHPEKIK